MGQALRTALRLVLAVTLALPVMAQAAVDRAELSQLADDDVLVQNIGWRMATGNAAYCPRTSALSGLTLGDARGFADPAAVVAARDKKGEIWVAAVATGSPAAAAGLERGDTILQLAGTDPSTVPAQARNDWRRLLALEQRMAEALADQGQLEVVVARPSGPKAVSVIPVRICAPKFELHDSGKGARATRDRVIITQAELRAFNRDENRTAALIAHEFAHAVLDHQDALNQSGRNWREVRRTESEADRLAVWLLANAGYPPGTMSRMMAEWGPRNDKGVFGTPDHPGWRKRLAAVEAEEAVIASQAGKPADWPSDFRREPPTD